MYMRSHGYADFHAAVHGSLASDIASLKNTAPEFPNGFLTLCERGHVDSTIEGFVVTNAGLFGELFTEEELEAAQTFYNLGKAMRGV